MNKYALSAKIWGLQGISGRSIALSLGTQYLFRKLNYVPNFSRYSFDRYSSPAQAYNALVRTLASAKAEFEPARIRQAYDLASVHHARADNAIRDDGKPYIYHPVEIALYLATAANFKIFRSNHLQDIILASLLHDLPEDTSVTLEQIKALFGTRVAYIVQDLTKDSSLSKRESSLAAKLEHLDRVERNNRPESILIKIADRIHNLLTNESPNNKRQRRMELPEIDRWFKFVENPIIPQAIRTEIVDLLKRELGKVNDK